MPSYDYFISYNKNDLKHARRIATLVKNAGLKCWWQNEDSRQEYANEIKTAIDSSSAFLVLLSPSSAMSEWVGKEILNALRLHSSRRLKILPVVCEELPKEDYDYFYQILGNFNWLFLSKYASDKELIHDITSQVGLRVKDHSVNSTYSAEAENERDRLRKQNNLYNLYATPALDDIFSELKCPAVIDVGCSDCNNIMSRLNGRSYSHLLCVDKEKSKLDEARERFSENSRVEFLSCDITKKTFSTMLSDYLKEHNLKGFDLIHISAVLLHIKNPLGVLKVLYEHLNQGGFILVQDEDDGYNLAYDEGGQEPTFFEDCFYIWEHSKESGDRKMARKLPILLKRAGFKDIDMKASIIASTDFGGKYKEDLWDIYFNPLYWVVDSEDYFDKADAFEKCVEYESKHDKMKAKYLRGGIYLSLGVPVFVAKK